MPISNTNVLVKIFTTHLDGGRSLLQLLSRVFNPSSLSASAVQTQSNLVRITKNAVVEICSHEYLARGRSYFKKQPISRVLSIELDTCRELDNRKEEHTATSLQSMSYWEWLSKDRPTLRPHVVVSSSSPPPLSACAPLESKHANLREIVVGVEDYKQSAALEELFMKYGEPSSLELPNIYKLDGGLAVRLLPTLMSSLIIQVDDLEDTKEKLQENKIGFEAIGSNGAFQGQIMLSSLLLDGLDIRFCRKQDPLSPFFCEGEEVLKEDVLEELNPAMMMPQQVPPQDSSRRTPATAYQQMTELNNGMGDCWSEFRATMRNPSGWLKKR